MPKSNAKVPPRRIIRKRPDEKPECEGKGGIIVRMRDLSLKEDKDVLDEMAKVTFEHHDRVDNIICRQEVLVELTDVSTQADLIPGNSVKDIRFSTGGGLYRGRREPPEMAPSPPVQVPPVANPIASSRNFSTLTFRGDNEISPSAAEAIEGEAPEGKTNYRIKGLVSGSARRKAEAEAKRLAETKAKWQAEVEADLRAKAAATAKAKAEVLARAAVTIPSQVRILANVNKKAKPSKPSPSVQDPPALPASNKKKRKRKNKPAASRAASTPSPAVQVPQ